VSWVIFLAYEISIGCNRLFSSSPLCPHSDRNFGKFYWYSCSIVFGGFLFTWSILFTRILQSRPGNERVPYFTAFNILSMSSIASLLEIAFTWGGVCTDVLG